MFDTMMKTRSGEISPTICNATSRAAEAGLVALDLALKYADDRSPQVPLRIAAGNLHARTDHYPDAERNGTHRKK